MACQQLGALCWGPVRNATGFALFEFSLGTKWLELLKELAPGIERAAVLRDAAIPSGVGQWDAISSAAASLGVQLSPVDVRDAAEIEREITTFARLGNGGLIIQGSPCRSFRELIIALAARHKLPAVYFLSPFVIGGGLISYGADLVDHSRRAAGYVDRILKGEKPADLPVQVPTRYELVLNLKTAKAVDIDVPATVPARADDVIE